MAQESEFSIRISAADDELAATAQEVVRQAVEHSGGATSAIEPVQPADHRGMHEAFCIVDLLIQGGADLTVALLANAVWDQWKKKNSKSPPRLLVKEHISCEIIDGETQTKITIVKKVTKRG
jgi:hypothetical protein